MSEVSAVQVAANRANGALSHGRTTEEGKRRSSLNATRHGLAGRIVVLPSEDMAKFQEFSQKLIHSLDPRTPMEEALAQTVADQQWRFNRIRAAEDGMLASHFAGVTSADTDTPKSMPPSPPAAPSSNTPRPSSISPSTSSASTAS